MTQGRFHAFDLSLAGTRHRGVATLAALALALPLAACGGGGGARLSKSDYEHHIQQDSNQINDVFKPLAQPPSSLSALASQLKSGQDKLRSAADDLDSVTPPKDIEHDNDVLVAGLRALADDLDPLRRGAEKQDYALVQRAIDRLKRSHSLVKARQATEDMKKKGYKITSLGS